MITPDISADVYELLDKAGLTLANLQNTNKSQTKIIQEVRVELATRFTKYVKDREKLLKDEVQI